MTVGTFVRAMRIEPYGWHLYVFTDRAKLVRFVTRRTGGQKLMAYARDCDGMTINNAEQKEFYTGVFDHSVSTLAHEMCHVSVWLLANAGVTIDQENDEPLAYLVGYLVRECQSAIEDKL